MGDAPADVVERCAQFWGDAYVRAAYAAAVTQHVADDQRVRANNKRLGRVLQAVDACCSAGVAALFGR